MKTCSITLDIIQITPSTTFYPNKLNTAVAYGLGLITLNFLVCMMTEILLIECFLRHTIQSNVSCFNVSSFNVCCFDFIFVHFFIVKDAFCHLLIKLLCMYVHVYVLYHNVYRLYCLRSELDSLSERGALGEGCDWGTTSVPSLLIPFPCLPPHPLSPFLCPRSDA